MLSSQEFNPAEHADYTDLRGNPYVKPDDAWFNSRILVLGTTGG